MRIAELSRQSGVSPASIKYYAREGLLAAGERTGYNQTEYGEQHVARLRLVRALIEAGGLTVAAARSVLAAIDDDAVPLDHTLGIAQQAIGRSAEAPSADAVTRIRDLATQRGWHVHDDNPGIALAAGVLDRYELIGRGDLAAVLPRYAEAADLIAEADLDVTAISGSRERMAETVVVGTVLGDTLLAGLRRIAQEHRSHLVNRPTEGDC